MNKIILFATSPSDAYEYCLNNDLNFDEVIWVLNYQLLGTKITLEGADIRYTELFTQMPAYDEAKAAADKANPKPEQLELPLPLEGEIV